jgi:hypothetical protein
MRSETPPQALLEDPITTVQVLSLDLGHLRLRRYASAVN